MKSVYKSFSKLTTNELYQILKLRQDVFIIEQDCIYGDIDGNDSKAYHLLFLKDDTVIAYLRIFAPGVKVKEVSMGRIIVSKDFRGTGLGKTLIEKGIELCTNHYPDTDIRIEAQAALMSYYNQYGFKEEGEVYLWDGIDHIQMVRKSS